MTKRPTGGPKGRKKAGGKAAGHVDGLAPPSDLPSGERIILDGFEQAERVAETPPAPDAALQAEADPPKPRRRSEPFRETDAGVERRIERTDPDTGKTRVQWRWVCSPLKVTAATRNADGEEWGLIIQLQDHDGVTRDWAMPLSMLAGDGAAYRERLLSLGATIASGREARVDLHTFLATAIPKARARCVGRLGWHGRTFVAFDRAYEASTSSERFILQTAGAVDHAYRVAGSLDGWQRDIARLAVGNSRLGLALSAAFAAPLLHPTNTEGGGFHLRGGSSTGKTTALIAAGSVWGGGGIRGFIRTWRATANGIEGIAGTHCDALLCLDELGQVDGGEAGHVAYMLANGQGKARANRFGEARPAAEWRTLFLSTGEMDLATKIAEDGRGRRIAAGQEVRVVDIPADAGHGLGLFEDLHGFPSADALARHLKLAAEQHFGHAARRFLELIAKGFDDLGDLVAGHRTEFLAAHCPAGADGQVSRVASRFALIAAAGEMATAFGLLPWPRGEATRAAAACFGAWLDARGGIEAAEVREAVATVRRFVELHGSSRFEPIGELRGYDSFMKPLEYRIVNRAGYKRTNPAGQIEYLFLPETWKKDVCDGRDSTAVAKVLQNRGVLIGDSAGKLSRMCRVPDSQTPIRCYVVTADILGGTTASPPDQYLEP